MASLIEANIVLRQFLIVLKMSEILMFSTRKKRRRKISKWLWCTISFWKNFHKYNRTNQIYVIIHVENTFKAVRFNMCGKINPEKMENHETHDIFLVPGPS